MTKHYYFGNVEADWAGFSSENEITVPYFDTKVTVFLGDEYDEYEEEIETPPTAQQLAEYEETLKNFLSNFDSIIIDIQQCAFSYYQNYSIYS